MSKKQRLKRRKTSIYLDTSEIIGELDRQIKAERGRDDLKTKEPPALEELKGRGYILTSSNFMIAEALAKIRGRTEYNRLPLNEVKDILHGICREYRIGLFGECRLNLIELQDMVEKHRIDVRDALHLYIANRMDCSYLLTGDSKFIRGAESFGGTKVVDRKRLLTSRYI